MNSHHALRCKRRQTTSIKRYRYLIFCQSRPAPGRAGLRAIGLPLAKESLGCAEVAERSRPSLFVCVFQLERRKEGRQTTCGDEHNKVTIQLQSDLFGEVWENDGNKKKTTQSTPRANVRRPPPTIARKRITGPVAIVSLPKNTPPPLVHRTLPQSTAQHGQRESRGGSRKGRTMASLEGFLRCSSIHPDRC
jgi:hypothetical protein